MKTYVQPTQRSADDAALDREIRQLANAEKISYFEAWCRIKERRRAQHGTSDLVRSPVDGRTSGGKVTFTLHEAIDHIIRRAAGASTEGDRLTDADTAALEVLHTERMRRYRGKSGGDPFLDLRLAFRARMSGASWIDRTAVEAAAREILSILDGPRFPEAA